MQRQLDGTGNRYGFFGSSTGTPMQMPQLWHLVGPQQHRYLPEEPGFASLHSLPSLLYQHQNGTSNGADGSNGHKSGRTG